jgi:hypothetical protein
MPKLLRPIQFVEQVVEDLHTGRQHEGRLAGDDPPQRELGPQAHGLGRFLLLGREPGGPLVHGPTGDTAGLDVPHH